jgi:hypothetical protein
MDVIPDTMASWSDNWIQANALFEEKLNSDDDLKYGLGWKSSLVSVASSFKQ